MRSREQFIAQGVAEGNQEGLGTGLAFEMSSIWPEAQAAFKKHARSGRFRGGSIWVIDRAKRPGLVYLATQPDMYHATLPYLRKGLRALARWAAREAVESVGLPKIGAGLGKLSWAEEVKPLFRDHLRADPLARASYEAVKRQLAECFPTDVDSYLAIKQPVMNLVYRSAEQWAAATGWEGG